MIDYDDEFAKRLKAVMRIRDNEHFTEDLYYEAVDAIINEDGTKGPHFSLEEVKKIVEKYEIDLGEYNIFDYAYSLNSIYADYFKAIPDNDKSYVEVAKAFLFDEDGPKGKAVKYYMAMRYGNE